MNELEYERLKVLADAAKESMPQAFRRLLHEKVDACQQGSTAQYCEGWQRAEKFRGAMLAVIASLEEVLK